MADGDLASIMKDFIEKMMIRQTTLKEERWRPGRHL
jgi:hypothetical protein